MAIIIDEVVTESLAPAETRSAPVPAVPGDTEPQIREILAAHARAQARARRLSAA